MYGRPTLGGGYYGEKRLGDFGHASVVRGRRMSIAIGLVFVVFGLLNFSGVLFTHR